MDYKNNFLQLSYFFRDQGISLEKFCQYLIKYPWLWTKSLNSLKTKQAFLEQESLEKNLLEQSYYPKILSYPFFTFLKPRGLLMKRYNKVDWEMAMKLKDEEFCKQIQCDLSELQELKEK